MNASDKGFFEVEFTPVSGSSAAAPVPQSQKISMPERNEIRKLFYAMRDIGRQYSSPFSYSSRFYDRKISWDNARSFYKQAAFMKDFADDYSEQADFSAYFPCYQMMGYEQLRTYFTWRTQVRAGNVAATSASYVFLYLYELLHNIGASDPSEGLDRLMCFYDAYKGNNSTVDNYILLWLKDYHIYYELPHSFKEFAATHGITECYPDMTGTEDDFDLFCAVSKYDIRGSAFYTDKTKQLTSDCFNYILSKIRLAFEAAGHKFDDALFRPNRRMSLWNPFTDALFYPWLKQPNRRVVLSENEIYICTNSEWSHSTVLTKESGRQFIGYVMKQMESVLRKITKYKYKLSASISMINPTDVQKLEKMGISIEKLINGAVVEFYREATKTVVTVNRTALTRIRREALTTQEALTVEEQSEQELFVEPSDNEVVVVSDTWEGFKAALTELEVQALSVISKEETSIKSYADDNNIMLEVLAEGINEKATDYIGDNVLDEEFLIYEDYAEQIKEILQCKGMVL